MIAAYQSNKQRVTPVGKIFKASKVYHIPTQFKTITGSMKMTVEFTAAKNLQSMWILGIPFINEYRVLVDNPQKRLIFRRKDFSVDCEAELIKESTQIRELREVSDTEYLYYKIERIVDEQVALTTNFTKLDFVSSFRQSKVHEDSRKLTRSVFRPQLFHVLIAATWSIFFIVIMVTLAQKKPT